jgi:hypothetical protein
LGVPLIAGLLFNLMMQEPVRINGRSNRGAREVCAALWGYRAVLIPLMVSSALVGGIADGAAVIWAAPTLSRLFEFSPARVGALMASVLMISGLLGPILGGAIADLGQQTGGPHRTVTVLTGLLILSIPTALFGLAPGFATTILLLALFLILGTAFQVAMLALTTIVIPNALHASSIALMLTSMLLFAYGVAPMVVSHLAGALGGAAMIGTSLTLVCVSSSVVGAVTLFFGRRPFREMEVQRAGATYPGDCAARTHCE